MSKDVSRRTGWSQRAESGVLARLAPDDAPGPEWLAEARRSALGWVSEHGFPTAKHEDWRYTKLGPILALPLEPAAPDGPTRVDAAFLAGRCVDLGGPRLVFVNGHFRPELSRTGDLPAGVCVLDLASALREHRESLEPVLIGGEPRDGFLAANAALAPDGAFVQLAADTAAPDPIHLIFVSDVAPGASLLASPRIVCCLGADSRASVVQTHVGRDSGGGDARDAHCVNLVADVRLEPGARLRHFTLQDEPPTAYHLASLDVRLAAGSSLTGHSVMLGAAIARQETRVRFEGEGARLDLDGVYLPAGEQTHDNTLFVDHAVPGCTSNQLFKGVLSGKGRGVFNGHVLIREGADRTEAHQTNKNLLLSDGAEADTRPRLEIYADDVKATHGSAVGQLDADALLYLRSRGVPAAEARRLLVRGFVQETIERIDLVPLRERVQALLAERSFG